MSRVQIYYKWVQFKGEVKRQWGRVTGDRLLQIEGDLVKFAGRLHEQEASRRAHAQSLGRTA